MRDRDVTAEFDEMRTALAECPQVTLGVTAIPGYEPPTFTVHSAPIDGIGDEAIALTMSAKTGGATSQEGIAARVGGTIITINNMTVGGDPVDHALTVAIAKKAVAKVRALQKS